jgi:hypothetical protein
MTTCDVTNDRIERIMTLTAGLPHEIRVELLEAIADLLESYPATVSPWDFNRFSDGKDVPKTDRTDKPPNNTADDAKRIREGIESIGPVKGGQNPVEARR